MMAESLRIDAIWLVVNCILYGHSSMNGIKKITTNMDKTMMRIAPESTPHIVSRSLFILSSICEILL